MFTLSKTNLKSAMVSVLITGAIAVITYIIGIGDIFKISAHQIANIGAMSLFTGTVSLLKSLLTTSDGNFLGTVKVVPTVE